MAQASPTNILLTQAAYRIEQLQQKYGLQRFKAPEDIVELITKATAAFEENAGKALTDYVPLHNSEVPNSSKMNEFWRDISADINILQQQLDLLRAATVSTHNFQKTEITKASRDNLKAQNKLKTLELYSSADDASLIFFGDTFITEDFIDWSLTSAQSTRLQIFGNQSIGLGLSTQQNALEDDPKIDILEGSNGMLGNNEEIRDPTDNTTTPTSTYTQYQYKSDIYPANDLESITDGAPNTWIEFEKYLVDDTNRSMASNYNFNYKYVESDQWDYLKPFIKQNNTINWADGLGNDPALVLNLEVDLRSPQPVNMVTLLPFGLEDNINNPIKIKRVSTSLDRTNWTVLGPQNMWLANSIDRKIVDINSDNIIIGQGSWSTDGSPIRFIRFEIEQQSSIPSNIGHLYYFIGEEQTTTNIKREIGPIPTLNEPNQYANANDADLGELTQRMEYFVGRRWAIGIRDIGVYSNTYQEKGSFVSSKFEIPGVVDRVALDAEVEIPATYSPDYDWVKFYVSPNNGADWFQISNIQDDFTGVPEIIAFNDPTPADLREPGVAYYEVPGKVNSIRLKVEMERPSTDDNSTPLLKPYTLRIKKRG